MARLIKLITAREMFSRDTATPHRALLKSKTFGVFWFDSSGGIIFGNFHGASNGHHGSRFGHE
jgi:hypothetical protein